MRDRFRTTWSDAPLGRRLVIGVLAVTATALLVMGLATYLSLRTYLVRQVDANLTVPRDDYYLHLASDGDIAHGLSEATLRWTQNGSTVALIYADGTAHLPGQNLGPAQLPDADDNSALSTTAAKTLATVPTTANADPVTITLPGYGQVRAVAVPAHGAQIRGTTITISSVVAFQPLSRIGDVSDRLVLVMVASLLLALGAVAVLSTLFIRNALRPLRRVADTATQVATLPLDRGDVTIPARVPVEHPGTEVGQVGLAVNSMLDHVESSLQSRHDTEARLRSFVSDAGHELRTPLAAVRGYAELVRRAGPDHPEQALESSRRIEAAARRMGMLVEDLLLLASLDEQRPLAHDVVDLRDVASEAVSEARTTSPEHQWETVDPDGPVEVVGDALRLHQAVANLLANATAHTPAGTTVVTSVSVGDGRACLQVRDDGPGFATDLLPRATERFTRGDASRSRATGGSGLGLSIVKAVAEAHGGTLEVANATAGGPGAVIRILLPLHNGAARAEPAPVSSQPVPAAPTDRPLSTPV